MTQEKSLITLSASIPPQEVFINNGSFVAHKGLPEFYEYSYRVRQGVTVTIPLNNDFPILITNLFWSVDSAGFTLQSLVRGFELWLFDTTSTGDIVQVKPFVLSDRATIKIINKSSSGNLDVIFQAERVSLIAQPNLTL